MAPNETPQQLVRRLMQTAQGQPVGDFESVLTKCACHAQYVGFTHCPECGRKKPKEVRA